MRIDVLTLFPEALAPYLGASILGRAQASGRFELHLHQLRDYSDNPIHKTVDDRPFGGGAGMVLKAEPIVTAVEAIERQLMLGSTDTNQNTPATLRILPTPQGRRFTQADAQRFVRRDHLLFICGHYEGYDERIVDVLEPEQVSLGDFVMTGGELAALAMIDSVVRLLPGATGNAESTEDESFSENLLEYPQYTRPREYRGHSVPDILLSGNHAEIEAWRREESRRRTAERRPDLLSDEAAPTRAQHAGLPGDRYTNQTTDQLIPEHLKMRSAEMPEVSCCR